VEEALKMIEMKTLKSKSGFKVDQTFQKSLRTLYTGTVNVSKERESLCSNGNVAVIWKTAKRSNINLKANQG